MTKKTKSTAAGEFFTHSTRANGTRNLYFGTIGADKHGHAVIDGSGNVRYLREADGRQIAAVAKTK